MTTISSPPRPRWYPITVVILVLAIAVFIAVPLLGLVDDDSLADGVLSFLTGLFVTVTVGLVAVTEIGRRNDAQLRDAASLDDLEPLRAAASSDGSNGQTTPTSNDRRR